MLDEVLASGAPRLSCEYFSFDGSPFEQGPAQEPGEIGYSLSVRRSTLDAILARRAATSGVDVRTRTKVADIGIVGGEGVDVTDDRGGVHRARVVVGADGRRSTVARLVGAADEERHPPARAMYYRYATGWRGQTAVGAEFALHGDQFSYVFPSDGDVACLAVSVPLSQHELARDDPASHLTETFRRNPQTVDRIDDVAWTSGVYTGLPADSVWKAPSGPGWVLVGDAGTAQDPWAGLGMDSAARQAEAFVEAFTSSPDDWHGSYARLRRERTYPGYQETTRLAPDLRQLLG